MQRIGPNYNWENGIQTDKDHWRKFDTKLYLVSVAEDKTLASGSKCIKHIFFIFTTICLISAEWIWLI